MKRLSFNPRFVNEAGNDLIAGKIHTIRQNYKYWKRFEGREVALFTWEGKPYQKGSIQKVFCKKRIKSVQEIDFDCDNKMFTIQGKTSSTFLINLAKNDGFDSLLDLYCWFADGDYKSGNMILIHFTNFKY